MGEASLANILNARKSGYKANVLPKHYPGFHATEHLSTLLLHPGGQTEVLVLELLELQGWITSSHLATHILRIPKRHYSNPQNMIQSLPINKLYNN